MNGTITSEFENVSSYHESLSSEFRGLHHKF